MAANGSGVFTYTANSHTILDVIYLKVVLRVYKEALDIFIYIIYAKDVPNCYVKLYLQMFVTLYSGHFKNHLCENWKKQTYFFLNCQWVKILIRANAFTSMIKSVN